MSDNSLLEKLETFYIRFREIGQLITDPEVIQDMNRFVKLNKEYRDLEQIVEARDELKRAVSSYDEAQEILNTETDKELKEMAEMEIEELDAKIPELESKVKMSSPGWKSSYAPACPKRRRAKCWAAASWHSACRWAPF